MRIRNTVWRELGRLLLPLAIFIAAAALFLAGLGSAGGKSREEGRRAAEESLRRAAVSCYAIEGSYPESYQYLSSRYGVRIDESAYVVQYTVFASNLMPDITVLTREADR